MQFAESATKMQALQDAVSCEICGELMYRAWTSVHLSACQMSQLY